MEFSDAVHSRKMTRRFLPEPLDEALLDRLFSLALRSPSAGSTNGVDLLVLRSEDSRTKFWETISDLEWREEPARSFGLTVAPVIVIPVASPNAYLERYARDDKSASVLSRLPLASWPVPYWSIDAAFVAMTLLLSVTDLGLGALFFHLQGRDRELLSAFGIAEGTATIGAIAIGKPDTETTAERPRRRARRVEERIHFERW
ncbi:MAG TPA: nitroreductase family protein [Acidimicrobiales bacterium]|nr:nitroreductase family protein [Acidimicrobiales bacterium]